MKTLTKTLPVLALAGLFMGGCPGDDGPPAEDSTTSDDTTAGPTTNTTPPTTMTDPDTTATTTEAATETIGETDPTTTTTGEPGPFVFEETPFDQYTQVDRMGFPAVNTGLNLLGDKDEYNAASPADDAALMFVTNVVESLETLHLGAPGMQTPDNTGVDDDLIGLGITPCVTPPLPMDTCDDQGAPFVIPDVIEIVLDQPTGFPNGRQLEVPVMDIILAVILLDLDTHDITLFIDLDGDGVPGPSLNPLANDVPFEGDFPYLAAAHQ